MIKSNKYNIFKLMDRAYNIKPGVIKINVHNSFNHEFSKFLLCFEFASSGQEFLTEAIFENGKRADIVNLSTGEVWEITESESQESIEKKRAEYPLPINAIKAEVVIKHWLKKYKFL